MKIPTICENETNCYTDCGYWKYQLIARNNLQNITSKMMLKLLWVLTIPTNCNKETSKFYLTIMLSEKINQNQVQMCQIYKVREPNEV